MLLNHYPYETLLKEITAFCIMLTEWGEVIEFFGYKEKIIWSQPTYSLSIV